MFKNKSLRFRYVLAPILAPLMLTACSTTGSKASNVSLLNSLAAPDSKYAGATSIKRLSIPAGLSSPNFVNDFDVPDSVAAGAVALSLSDKVPSVRGVKVPASKEKASEGLKMSLGAKPSANLKVVTLGNDLTGLVIPEVGKAAWNKLNAMLGASGFSIKSRQPEKQRYTTLWAGTRYQTLAMIGEHRIKVEQSFLDKNTRHHFGLVPYQGQTAIVVQTDSGQQINANDIYTYLRELY